MFLIHFYIYYTDTKQAKMIINSREEAACFSQLTDPDYSRKHNISNKAKRSTTELHS